MKKLNWGNFILSVYVGFVVLVILMVYMASKQDFDLVSENYYKEEIEYQTKIDANTNQTNSANKWKLHSNENQIEITLENYSEEKKPIGKIEFYRPSNSKLDIVKELDLNTNGKMFVSTQNFKQGAYIVKIHYKVENKDFFEQVNFYYN